MEIYGEIRTAYEFGPYRLDVAERQLLKGGEPVALYPKAFDTLAALVRKHGHLVTKDELLKEVWPDTFVEESNLCNNISLLRKALGEDRHGYIETVPRYGYRFVGDVREIRIPEEEMTLREHTVTRFVVEEEDDRESGEVEPARPPQSLNLPALVARPRGGRSRLYATGVAVVIGVAALVYWRAPDAGERTGKEGVRALRSNLRGGERTRAARHHTENVEAYEAYLRGLYFWSKRTEEGLTRSVEYFEQATRLDPHYALAYAGLADSYALLRHYGFGPVSGEEALQKARAAATKSLSLDDSIAEAHAASGLIRTLEGDFVGAEVDFKRALELMPDSSVAHFRYASFLLPRKRLEEAETHARRAQELDPLSTINCSNYASILFFQRRYPEAVEYSRKALEIDPHHFHGLLILALSYEQMGRYTDAVALLEKRKELRGSHPDHETLRSLGHAYALSGRSGEARRMLSQLDEWSGRDRESLFSKVLVHAALGEKDKAFSVLEKLAADWEEAPLGLRIDPRYDVITSDARYAALLRRRFGNTM